MTDEAVAPDTFDFLHAKWFWVSAAVVAGLCVALVVAWYIKHPDHDLFTDFTKARSVGIPDTNGHVPHPTPTPSPAGVESEADG